MTAIASSCSRPGARRSGAGWSWSATTSPRRSMSRPRSWSIARPGCPARPVGPVPHRQPQCRPRAGAGPPQRPYVKFGGLRFFEAAHVNVLAMLRWAENPRDQVAAFRVLQLLPGVGPGSPTLRRCKCREAGGVGGREAAGGAPNSGQVDWSDGGPGWSTLANATRPSAGASTIRCWRSCTTSPPVGAPIWTSWSGWPPPCRGRERFLTELTLDRPRPLAGLPAAHKDETT